LEEEEEGEEEGEEEEGVVVEEGVEEEEGTREGGREGPSFLLFLRGLFAWKLIGRSPCL